MLNKTVKRLASRDILRKIAFFIIQFVLAFSVVLAGMISEQNGLARDEAARLNISWAIG
jgi:hypothetical protein